MFRLRVQRGCRPEPAEVVDNHSMSDWSDEETAPCFIVRDSNGQALAFVYCEDESGRPGSGQAAHPRRSAPDRGQHAKLPDLLHKP